MHTDVAAATAAAVVLATASDNMSSAENNNGTNNDWRLWCRLCAKEDPQGNISVFFKDEQQSGGNRDTAVCAIAGSSDMSLAAAIGKYFWVEIKRDEDMPKMLCTECFSLVTSLVNFSERVAKVQQMFCVLHNSALVKVPALDLHAMRLKYGLLDEEREHVIMQHQLPEVHYFESKPKINDLEECIFGNETLMATSSNPLEQQQQQQQQPRIKIKIKKEDILEHTATDEDPDPDDEEDEDYDHENILNEEYDNDEENDDSNCKVVEEVEVEEEQKSLKLRARTIQRLQKPIEMKETTMEPPKKRRRRRRKRKLSLRNENKALNDVDENDDDVVDENESFEENKHEESVAGKLQLHLDETNYSCTDCPRKFKRTHHLRQHMKRAHAKATQLGELPCTQCTKVFSTTRQLETHAKVHLPPELRKVIPCPYCETKFSSHTVMQTHIKYIHMNERPFICEECGVGVRTNAALKAHMLTHTDYAPFECEVCKKGFKNQIRLKNHMETHDPNKHVCAKCGLQLNSRATLNRHLLVHSDEMQHKCDYCGRAFKRAKALKNHLILHTGLKPYSCDFCDRTFANGSNCRSHKKKSHPEELAALEAAGGGKTYTRNIPKLEALKAVTKAADNLAPVVSKQSGRFAFGKKPKLIAQEEALDKVTKPELLGNHNKSGTSPSSCSNTTLVLSNAAISTPTNLITLHSAALPTTVPAAGNQVTTMPSSIPNIDNIYSHIMKQASIAAHSAVNDVELAMHIKRPVSQASSCVTIDNDGGTSDMPAMQHQQQQHQHQMQSTTPAALAAMPTHLYTQIIKQNMLQQEQQQQLQEQQLHHHHHQHHQQQQQQQHQHLAHQQQMHVDDVASSIRSPESQTSSHLADDHSNTAASVQFYNHIRQNLQGPYI